MDSLAEKLQASLGEGPARGAAWAVREWDRETRSFACPAGAECAPRLSGVELISLAWEREPTLMEHPVNPLIARMTSHLREYAGIGHYRMKTIDTIAIYAAVDERRGSSGDLREDHWLLFQELLKSPFMREHLGARAQEAHGAAFQLYLVLAELLRHPHYDWRPPPGPSESPQECRLRETSVFILNLERSPERRDRAKAELAGGGWQFEFFDATDGLAVLGAEEVADEAATNAVPSQHDKNLRIFPGWRLAKDDPRMRRVPGHPALELPLPLGHSVHYWARDMNAGEVGCSMTYLRAWRHALERGLSEVVILEDDYVPVRPEAWCLMKEGLQDLRSREVGWDVLYLDSGYWFGDAAGAAAAADLPPHFSRVAFVYASHAILCSERGMRKLLEHNLEACLMPVDEYLPYLNNPAGHPRGREIQACLGLHAPPEDFVSLRWRGDPVVDSLPESAGASIIENRSGKTAETNDDFPPEDDEYEDGEL